MIKLISEEIYSKIDYAKSIASLSPNESFKISHDAYILARINKLFIEEGYALIGMAFASRSKSDVSSMLEYSYKALSIFIDKNHTLGEIKALNLIGIGYFYNSMYEEAMKCFLKITDLVDLNQDNFLLSSVLNNIGEIYRESQIFDKSMEYYKKAIDIVNVESHPLNHAVILGNIGEVYFAKKDFTKALETYKKSHNILIKTSDRLNIGECENRIGKVYFEIGDFKNAKLYYFKALKKLESINNKYYSIDVLINIANLYKEKASGKNLHFYEKAMEFAQDIGAKKKLSEVYQLISEYHEIQGDYKNALNYYKNYSNINEEIMSANLKTKLEILNIEIKNIEQTGKFEKLRNRLEKEIDRQKKELEKINIENEILGKKVYEDELTGIQNRRSINFYLKSKLEEMNSSEELIVLFMIDIDKFKGYNDYWGHSEGDVCLKKVADCMRKIQTSRNDVFGRYGGEEFIYISTSITYEDALILGNLIRTEVEDIGLYYIYEGERRSTTISVGGVIGRSSDFSSMAEMLELADKELYRAKDTGRNKTILNYITEK